jgi:hypothetical protein
MSNLNLNKTKLIISVMMNVLLISVFIGFFFFTYGSYIEDKIVKAQTKILSDDIYNIIKLFGKNVNIKIKEQLLQIKLPDLSKADENTVKSNKQIMMKAGKVNIIFTIVVVSVIYFLYNKSGKNFNMKTLIYQNLILLLFVALTEFSFITFFAADYISINTNNIKLNVIKSIENLINPTNPTKLEHFK